MKRVIRAWAVKPQLESKFKGHVDVYTSRRSAFCMWGKTEVVKIEIRPLRNKTPRKG